MPLKHAAAVVALSALSFLFTPLVSSALHAQSRDSTVARVIGQVLDAESGKPVAGVSVTLVEAHLQRLTDGSGRFIFPSVPRAIYLLRIEHLAYGHSSRVVNVPGGETVEVEVRLLPRAVALDSILVQVSIRNRTMERGGYYDRKRAGWGYYLEGDQLNRPWTTDILRDAPWVEVLTGSSALERYVRMRDAGNVFSPYCTPDVLLDGVHMPGAANYLDEIVQSHDIQAIEIYHGIFTPAELIHTGFFRTCGAIGIWTKQ